MSASKQTSPSQRLHLALHVLFPLTHQGLGFARPEADIGSFYSRAKEPGLLVCVMLRRQGLHPSSDSVEVPRALLWHREGSRLGAGTTWGTAALRGPCVLQPESPAFPRGELLLSCLRGPSPVHGAQVLSGLRGDLRRASCLLCSGDWLELG